MAKPKLSATILNELLRFHPDTGVLTWRPRGIHWFSDSRRFSAAHHMRSFNTRHADSVAMNCMTPNGYLVGRLLGRNYFAHRIVWAMHYDEWPDQIDHEDGNRSNNRLKNLRGANRSINALNAATPMNNTSGVVGVSWHPHAQSWRAVIGARPRIHLGYFKTFEDAVAVRKEAEKRLGYHPNHGRPASFRSAP